VCVHVCLQFAAKAADNELRGLAQVLSANVRGLSMPMMALLDYRGYRLVATTILPIGDQSVVYGSGDAGV